jgi:hypothetical protein
MIHEEEPTPFAAGGTLPLPLEDCETEFLPENDAFPGIQPVPPMYVPTPNIQFDTDPVGVIDVPAPSGPPVFDTPAVLQPRTVPVPVVAPTPLAEPSLETPRVRTSDPLVPDVIAEEDFVFEDVAVEDVPED